MITVVDYNMGNLRSVSKALEHLGAEVRVSSSAKDIETTDKLILPGVGAFGDACQELRALNLLDPIRHFLKSGKPFLGICLGLQLLFKSSEESPGAEGLGHYEGGVIAFRSRHVKIPHMGWNDAALKRESPILKNIAPGSFFYFVHTYYAAPKDPALTLGETAYGDEKFPAILGSGNIFATQFHPEKSQAAGLQILKNFIAL